MIAEVMIAALQRVGIKADEVQRQTIAEKKTNAFEIVQRQGLRPCWTGTAERGSREQAGTIESRELLNFADWNQSAINWRLYSNEAAPVVAGQAGKLSLDFARATFRELIAHGGASCPPSNSRPTGGIFETFN